MAANARRREGVDFIDDRMMEEIEWDPLRFYAAGGRIE